MTSFTYHRPSSVREALAALAEAGSRPIGGGTDLLPRIDDGLVQLTRVVDIRDLRGASEIELRADGSARIGAGGPPRRHRGPRGTSRGVPRAIPRRRSRG